MFMPDGDDSDLDLDDDSLPFGLDQQFRDLLLNVGDIDNEGFGQPGFVHHNFGLNFFGPVFGGDEDFGFNPGDDDLFLWDSDDDSYIDDSEEDDFQKIFVSLQDSHVIRRLSFHKNVEGVYRFPKPVLVGPGECYEEVYRLLEEVELLLKIWKKRISHPYTAHISHAPPPPSPHPGEGTLREGADYNQSDYEYDSDEEDDYDRLPSGGTNEALTKKKYCQSAKVFHQVFDSEKQMEVLMRSIVRMKKFIFSVMFGLFMDALPALTAASLPGELWEKVWKFSQNQYFRYKDSMPMTLDINYYKAGLRAETPQIKALEQERIRELFGAVGNIHMIVFEILFKNPCILQPSPMYELENGDNAADKFARSMWGRYTGILRQKFSRMQHLDSVLTPQEDPPQPTPALTTEQKIESGVYRVQDIPLPGLKGMEGYSRLDNCVYAIVGEDQSGVFLLLGRYFLDEKKEKLGLLLVVVSASTGQTLAVIKTGHSYQKHLMEVASHKVKRRSLHDWKNHFCVTDQRVTFLHRDVDLNRDHMTLWSWPLPPTPPPGASPPSPPVLEAREPLVSCEMAANLPASESPPSNSSNRFRHNTNCTVKHNKDIIIVVHQNPFIIHSSLGVYSAESGEQLISLPWPAKDFSLAGVQNNRALVLDQTDRRALFINLLSGEIIEVYTADSLNKEFSLKNEKWDVRFDCNPARAQFLICSRLTAGYKLMSYNVGSETELPVELEKGGGKDGWTYTDIGRNLVLVDGVLITNCKKELGDGSAPVDMYEDLSVKCHEIAAYGLASRTRHSVLMMAAIADDVSTPLLSELSLRWFDPPAMDTGDWNSKYDQWDPEKRSVFMISDTKMGVLMEWPGIRIIDIDTNPRAVAEQEAEQVWEVVEAKRIAREREMEEKRKQNEERKEKRKKRDEEELVKRRALEEQFMGEEKTVTGNIIEWRYTYGFAKSKGAANRLGRVFLHKNDVSVAERRMLKKGTQLEYQIGEGREPGTYRAKAIKVVPRTPKEEGAKGKRRLNSNLDEIDD